MVPIATALMFLGPRYIPAPEVGLLLLLESILGPVWVWLVLGEATGEQYFAWRCDRIIDARDQYHLGVEIPATQTRGSNLDRLSTTRSNLSAVLSDD